MAILGYAVLFGDSAAAGAVGYCSAWIMRARRHRPEESVDISSVTDESVDREIEKAATEWARAHGRPELGGLLAEKAKLVWRTRYGRDPRRW